METGFRNYRSLLIVVFPKVETAFRMFDTDQDGFLSWEEFQQVNSQVFTAYMYYVLILKKSIILPNSSFPNRWGKTRR